MRIGPVAFDQPLWLLAFAAIPLLVAFYALANRARHAAMLRLLGDTARERLTVMAGRDRRAVEAAAAVLAFALVVTALAGPRWGLRKDRIERTGVDVAIVLDASRSMLAEDVVPSRMERAKREIRGLLDAASGSRVALVTFAGDARVLCPFTLDHDTVSLFLDEIDPTVDHAGGSNLGEALRVAAEALEGASGAGKAVVLLTDGEETGGDGYATSAAAKLASRGVKVHAIGLGSREGAKIPVVDDRGRAGFHRDAQGKEVVTRQAAALLADVARAGGGDYLDAGTTAFPMDELWRKRISRLAKASTGGEDVENLQPRFQWFLAGAVASTALWWLAPLGIAVRRRRESRKRRLAWGRAAAALALLALPVRASAGPGDDGRRGDELYRKGDFAGAAAAYESSARGVPNEFAAHNLGNARYRAGQFGAAAKSWADAAAMATAADARRDAHYNRGLALLQEAERDPALTVPVLEDSIEAFDAALGLDPSDADARHNRAIAIARWVDAQRSAQKGGGKSTPDGKGGQEDPTKDPDGDPEDGGGDGKPGEGGEGDRGEKKEGTGGSSSSPGEPKPGEDGTPSEAEIGTAEMERIDRLLDAREKDQRKLQRVKAGMHRSTVENDW